MEHSTPLGQCVEYPERYAPELLCSIKRCDAREALALRDGELPFVGVDLWTAYEMSWLDVVGKPQVRIGEILVPCDSPQLPESKSLKLYLNSLNQTRFASDSEAERVLTADLSRTCGVAVEVTLYSLDEFAVRGVGALAGECIDACRLSRVATAVDAAVLTVDAAGPEVDEVLYSHLFKSNCPVTGQPDWASVQIAYRGRVIDRSALLCYLVSFRRHRGFHESCVERIFVDIQQRCAPERLMVLARFCRRGGLDINPLRRSPSFPMADGSGPRLVRQ